MNKFLVYTSNLRENPKSMREVIRFAEETPKFYITSAELNSQLANAKEGDNIITAKGNSAYVIRTFDKSLEDLSREDRDYIDTLTRRYGLKKSNISGVSHVIKFETWCKSACPLVEKSNNNSKKTSEKMGRNSFSNLSDRLKERFMPSEAENVRIATDGNICVETPDGYVAIDAAGNLTAYPEELTLPMPVFVISKPVAELVEGDVIQKGNRYYKIVKIADGKLSTIGYNGVGHSIKTITDFVLGASERVVVSLAGNLGGGTINPMMLIALSGDKKGGKSTFDSLLPFMLMNQNGGNIAANPMMLALLAGKDGDGFDMKDMLLWSAIGGGNIFGGATAAAPAGGLFGNIFGTTAAAPAAAAPAKKKPATKKAAKAPAE